MPAPLIAYVATLVTFLALEGGWLAVAGPRLYKPQIGSLLREKPRLAPAALFYVLYLGAVVWLIVLPSAPLVWWRGMFSGCVLGLAAYGTYDLTCASTMKTWSTKVTVADMTWGAVPTGAAATVGVLAVQDFGN